MPTTNQSKKVRADGVVAARLSSEQLNENFCDLHAPLSPHEAKVAADRCYFCHDAPCITACPTSIDIPLFIRQISTGTPEAAATTIFKQNILGGMCARVCPTETLCEEACVRETAENDPVEIGLLQRFATDKVMDAGVHPFTRSAPTSKRIAVVGAGPSGLSCAHRLAMKGHDVVIYDGRAKAGGLNEFGIAAYKTVDQFAEREVEWLLSIGGISMNLDKRLGENLDLDQLQSEYDAVFLGIGLAGVNALGLDNEDASGSDDAVEFIAGLRQAADLTNVNIGRNVVVIGGGMTAVDAAVQAKLLGAEHVTLVYRRGVENMNASKFEQDLAAQKGVNIVTNAQPVGLIANGVVSEVEFAYTEASDDGLKITDDTFRLKADQVFKAIGQNLSLNIAGLDINGGKISVDENGQSSLDKVWAGGDCASGGDDLTVTAVAEGRDAAEDMHSKLMG